MTKSGVGIASDLCRTFVGPLAVVFSAFVALGTPAQAGAWEEFERRCLVPMENVKLEQPDDLEPKAKFKNDGDTYSKYDLGAGVTLSVSDGRSGRAHWCRIDGFAWLDVVSIAMLDWMRIAIPSGRYKAFAPETRTSPLFFLSTDWREPKIEMQVQPSDGTIEPFLFLRETDLES